MSLTWAVEVVYVKASKQLGKTEVDNLWNPEPDTISLEACGK